MEVASNAELPIATQLRRWRNRFCKAYEQDAGRRFKIELERFGLSGTAQDMVDATVDLVNWCAVMRQVDGQALADLLGRQSYSGRPKAESPFRLIFDLGGGVGAAVVVDKELRAIDLADIYEARWERLKRVGYTGFWVSRTDGNDLEPDEVLSLETAITADLRYDYEEDEVQIFFDPDTWPGCLYCSVDDNPGDDD